MPAYVIADIEVTDPERYEDYKKLSTAALEAYGGTFLVRGGESVKLEGPWDPHRVVVLEFPTREKAEAWWDSEEYAPAKILRRETAQTAMIMVVGND